MIKLGVKVVPGASSSKIVGWLGDELKIRISEAPEKGKANRAVVKLLAKHLEISASDIKIISGHSSSHKKLEINIDEALLAEKLPAN